MSESRKPKVIIADDERHCRVFLSALLQSMRCEVVAEATNGVEACELYGKHRPHLLLLDVNMPVESGEEALKKIMEQHPGAFVIMLTAVADLATVENCLSLGATNFIRKDTPIEEMKSILKESWQQFSKAKARSGGA